MAAASAEIRFKDASKFYGEVLGVNRISFSIQPGVTALVGPNGAGKTTLLNLMTGLLKPSSGIVEVLGVYPGASEELLHRIGYCSQHDSFPRKLTGREFVYSFLLIHGYPPAVAEELAWESLVRLGLTDAAHRRIESYSKGMRQRVKLAQAIAHNPVVLVLDEPLNGLDPMARAEMVVLFKELAGEGRYIVISSHVLHEVEAISDRIVLLNNGYIVAEGDIQGVRSEMPEHPLQVLIRCDRPAALAACLFQMDHVVEARIQEDQKGLLVRTRDGDRFYSNLNRIILEGSLEIETVAPADEDMGSVYQYLIGSDGGDTT